MRLGNHSKSWLIAPKQVKRTLFTSDGKILEKNDQTPVTIADIGVQALISLELGNLFPSIPLVVEEDSAFIRSANLVDSVVNVVTDKTSSRDKTLTQDDVLEAIDRGGTFGPKPATYWVLDPIDGTRGFVKGSVALYVMINKGFLNKAMGTSAAGDSMGTNSLTQPVNVNLDELSAGFKRSKTREAARSVRNTNDVFVSTATGAQDDVSGHGLSVKDGADSTVAQSVSNASGAVELTELKLLVGVVKMKSFAICTLSKRVGLSLVVEGETVLGVMGCPNWRGDKSNQPPSNTHKLEKDIFGSGIIMVAHVGCGTWSKGLPDLRNSNVQEPINWDRCLVDRYTLVHKGRYCISESQTWESIPLASLFGSTTDVDNFMQISYGTSGRASVFIQRARAERVVKVRIVGPKVTSKPSELESRYFSFDQGNTCPCMQHLFILHSAKKGFLGMNFIREQFFKLIYSRGDGSLTGRSISFVLSQIASERLLSFWAYQLDIEVAWYLQSDSTLHLCWAPDANVGSEHPHTFTKPAI
ncbi:inositol monophosphatase family protein [Artemisia annua]|uniref:Inositol monophosphatase family protein n=1 Tax=Artemisia annua TaxID=35608 RepID=A0A2U1KY32_ARTAN|nr:inositol monophosphatase family protein [Artemisia annua]